MANLIKGQLLKHLSKFFKNMSADSFNLSTMKGQCDLYNLELNEEVLMDLLELPVWLNLSKATCNRVTIRIPWTKLKTLPIQFLIDEVIVTVETVETFRKTKNTENAGLTNTPRKYGYVERLIEGIRISINSIMANFSSYKFNASFQLSHLVVESRTPAFKQTPDLRFTRIKDEIRGQLLTFKHIEWQTLKLEAKSETGQLSTPLRLITSRGSCRITIKKQLVDCQVLAARILVIFDDLRWVLTDAMLLSAFHLIIYLNSLIEKSPITKKVFHDAPTPTRMTTGFLGLSKATPVKPSTIETSIGRFFTENDVPETSYHLYIKPLEVYLCDDLNPKTGRSSYPPLSDGGCLHVIISSLVMNAYPYHKCLSSRQNWLQSTATANEFAFVNEHLYSFAEDLRQKDGVARLPLKKEAMEQLLKGLLSVVTVVRISDYTIEMVSTNSGSGKGRRKPEEARERRLLLKTCALPDDMPAVYLEMNQYYYYQVGSNRVSLTKAAPQPTTFLQIAPLQLIFDPLTLLWVNSFYNNLHSAILELKCLIPNDSSDITMHTRIELLMPTLVLDLNEGPVKVDNKTKFQSMEIRCTRIVLTNNVKEPLNLKRLNSLMERMGTNSLLVDRESYPWIKETDTKPVSKDFIEALEFDHSCSNDSSKANSGYRNDVWVGNCDPFWIEFRDKEYNRVHPFLDPLQVTFWVYVPPPATDGKTNATDADLSLLFHVETPPKIIIDHSKFIYLMRLLEQLDNFNDYMTRDNLKITTKRDIEEMRFPRVSISSVIPDVELLLVLDEKWNRTKSVGITACCTPMRSPMEDCFTDNYDAQSNIEDPLMVNQQAIVHANVGDEIEEPTVSIEKADSISLVFHKSRQQSLDRNDHDLLSRTRSYSTLASTPTDISPLDEDNRSDISAESDNFIILEMENVMSANPNDIFLDKPNRIDIEEATEASQDSVDSGTHSSDCREVPVSVSFLAVNIASLALVKQGRGFHSSMLLNCSNVAIKEWLNMPYDEYRNMSCSTLNSNGEEVIKCTQSEIRLRIDAIAKPDDKKDLMSILVKHLSLNLNVDTVTLISDFITDPDVVKVTAFLVLLNDVCATLNDPLVNKIPDTSIRLKELAIRRNEDNQLDIGYKMKSDLLGPHRELLNEYSPTRLRNVDTVNGLPDLDLVRDVVQENERLLLEIEKLKQENELLQNQMNSAARS